MRVSFAAVVVVFGSVLTTIVGAAMGITLMLLTPGTPTPTIQVNLDALLALTQFGSVVIVGVLLILVATLGASRGEPA